MEDEAALNSSNEQEVFVKLLVFSLTMDRRGKRGDWGKAQMVGSRSSDERPGESRGSRACRR